MSSVRLYVLLVLSCLCAAPATGNFSTDCARAGAASPSQCGQTAAAVGGHLASVGTVSDWSVTTEEWQPVERATVGAVQCRWRGATLTASPLRNLTMLTCNAPYHPLFSQQRYECVCKVWTPAWFRYYKLALRLADRRRCRRRPTSRIAGYGPSGKDPDSIYLVSTEDERRLVKDVLGLPVFCRR